MILNTRPVITGKKGVIAAGHYLATLAGQKIYALGGNGIDAAVAAGFALAVLKPHENSLGGECPILVYSPKTGKVEAVSGQGVAPAKATCQWFKDHNISLIPGDGYLGAAVPGTFGAYCTVLMHHGSMDLYKVMQPAIELAEEGFPMYKALRNVIAANQKKFLEEWPSTGEVFIPGGRIPEIGEIIRQPALARTLKELAEIGKCGEGENREEKIRQAMDYFYKGEIAKRILQYASTHPVKDASGEYHTPLLELEDFYRYKTRVEEPVAADYKQYRVFKCGPWTQGPVFLHQLKLLEGFPLKQMGHNTAEYIHTLVECAKLAFADREKYYGDPEFTDVPLDKLLSEEYNRELRKRIDPLIANNLYTWEMNEPASDEAYKGDTTHLDALDAEGYMISATPSGGWIPSSPIIPEVGFPLGTRVQVFNLKEGHPNCVEPGKRPRTTLTPSLVFKDGQPWMAFGTQGGDMQDQWTLQFFLNVVEFDMDIQCAVDAPTFHTCHFPNSFYPHNVVSSIVYAEQDIDRNVLQRLKDMGHGIEILFANSNGQVTAVRKSSVSGICEAAASPKYDKQAYAGAW